MDVKSTSKWTKINLFQPIHHRLNQITIQDEKVAHLICQLIPPQCPLARQIKLFGWTLLSIPPMCKLNPFYQDLMTLRFQALCYLADECDQDISRFLISLFRHSGKTFVISKS